MKLNPNLERNGDHYSLKRGPFSSHSQILRILGEGRGRILLDVGCAHAEIAAELRSQGWEILGVEPYAPAAAIARAKGIEVLQLPIEEALNVIDERFNVVLLADVLEHLVDPWMVMSLLPPLLTSDGIVLASVPNTAFLYVRLMILAGRFEYAAKGILDSTHLRFFTRKTAIELMVSAGLQVTAVKQTPIPLENLLPHTRSTRIVSATHRMNYFLANVWPEGLGYQFIIEGSPKQ